MFDLLPARLPRSVLAGNLVDDYAKTADQSKRMSRQVGSRMGGSLSSPRPPSSQGSDPTSYLAEAPASFRTNRQFIRVRFSLTDSSRPRGARSSTSVWRPACYLRSIPIDGHRKTGPIGPFRAQFQASSCEEVIGSFALSFRFGWQCLRPGAAQADTFWPPELLHDRDDRRFPDAVKDGLIGL